MIVSFNIRVYIIFVNEINVNICLMLSANYMANTLQINVAQN